MQETPRPSTSLATRHIKQSGHTFLPEGYRFISVLFPFRRGNVFTALCSDVETVYPLGVAASRTIMPKHVSCVIKYQVNTTTESSCLNLGQLDQQENAWTLS